MLIQESCWFAEAFARHLEDGGSVINLGSSTRAFREKLQPYIDANLFAVLKRMNVKVHHVDLKKDDGVDYAGDIANPEFLNVISGLRPNAIVCSNILEHVRNRGEFCRLVVGMLAPGGLIFASCPKDFPFHPDPIDTMFRPDVSELAAQFPGMTLVEGAVIECGTLRSHRRAQRRLAPMYSLRDDIKRLARLMLPMYKPRAWLGVLKSLVEHDDMSISASCVVLRKG